LKGAGTGALLGLLALLLAPAAPAQSVDPAALAQARQIIALSTPPEQNEQMIAGIAGGVAQAIAAANPGREADSNQVVQEYYVPVLRAHVGEFGDVPAETLARSFTKGELDQLLAFYQSSLGRKLVAAESAAGAAMATQGPQIANRLLKEAMKKMGPELGRLGMRVPEF